MLHLTITGRWHILMGNQKILQMVSVIQCKVTGITILLFHPTIHNLPIQILICRNHIIATLGGALNWNSKNTTSLNFFYSGQSGSPYSVIYASTPGNIINGSSSLPYIPTVAESNTMFLDAANRAAFNAFVDGDSYLKTRRGQYAERNGLRTPWSHDLDAKADA